MRCVLAFLIVFALAALAPGSEAQAFQTLIVSPNSVRFGQVKVGGRDYYSVSVQNLGDEDIQHLSVLPIGDSSQFYVSNFCGYLPRYGSCTVQVQFAPMREGMFTLDLSITGGTASGTAFLSGEAIQ